MIVDAAGLNFHTANFYLDLLTKKGLLEFPGKSLALYRTTENGMKTLEHLKAIEELISGE